MKEEISFVLNDEVYLLSTSDFQRAIERHVPPIITQPTSEEARKYQHIRLMLKGVMRTIVPDILKGVFGNQAPTIPPRADILQWTFGILLQSFLAYFSSHTWVIYVEKCDACKEGVYWIKSVSSDSDHSHSKIPATSK